MSLAVLPMTRHDLEPVLALWTETEGVGLNESDSPNHLQAYLLRNPNLSLVVRDGSLTHRSDTLRA